MPFVRGTPTEVMRAVGSTLTAGSNAAFCMAEGRDALPAGGDAKVQIA